MTQYSRSVVPGRGGRQPTGRDLDRLVFGDTPPPGSAPQPPKPANEDGADLAADAGETFDDDLPVRPFIDRHARDRRETTGRRRSDYSRLPDGASFRSQDGGSPRGFLMLGGALLVVGIFGAVVWNAYSQGVRGDEAVTAPRLSEDGPFKVRPAAEKPAESAALDATVFERFEGPAAKPSAEAEPLANPAPDTRSPDAKPAEQLDGKPIDLAPAAAVAAPPAKPVEPPRIAAAAPAPEPVPPPVKAASTGGFTSGGKYLVQIGASASEAGADEEWSRWKGKGGELFSGAEKVIVRADVGGRTVYRIRVGSFATAEAADSFCAAFKGKGGDCFRATR